MKETHHNAMVVKKYSEDYKQGKNKKNLPHDQENLNVSVKQTERYAHGEEQTTADLCKRAWGEFPWE